MRLLFSLFGLALSAAILWWIFQTITWQQVFEIMRQANRPLILAFVICSLTGSFFRMWRYHLMLRSNGFLPHRGLLYLVVLVRNLCVDLLPARLGSLMDVFLFRTRLGIPLGPATSTFLLAFLFDLLALVPIVSLAVLSVSGLGSESSTTLLVGSVGLGIITLGLLKGLPLLVEKLVAVIGASSPNHSLKARMKQLFISTHQSLQETQRKGIFWKIFFLSLLVRIAKYSSLYFLLFALLQPQGFRFSDLPFAKGVLGLCAAELSASLPSSGLAGIGVYQGAWALAFQALGLDPQIAKITSVSHHLFTQVYGYCLGLLALGILLLPVSSWKKT